MKRLRVIQFGDIHLPDNSPTIDNKDDGFPPELAKLISARPLQGSLRKAVSLIREDPTIKGLFLTGDLTSRGCLEHYRKCVQLLTGLLNSSVPHIFHPQFIHAVPGNHDINRAQDLATSAATNSRFQPLSEAWESAGMPILATDRLRASAIPSDGPGELHVFSMNSCHGCGDKRSLPSAVQEELYKVLYDHANNAPEDSFNLETGDVVGLTYYRRVGYDVFSRSITALKRNRPCSVICSKGHHGAALAYA